GVPGLISDTWNAISAPPKTPAAIIAKLNKAVNDIIAEPETKARFRELNLIAAGGSPEDMARLKREETERWSKVIRDAGIQPEGGSRDNVRRELVLDMGNAVAQVELALLEPLHLQHI